MSGKLIVIEGMDGAGTTTQTKMLHDHLGSLGLKVTNSAEPTRSPLGLEIRRLLAQSIEKNSDLLTSLALCFAADRMQHVASVIKPGLKTNDYVLLDRYVLSSMVYQGIHLPTAFVKEINRFAIKPDLTIILDLDINLAFKRLQLRLTTKDIYETPSMLEKIRARYLHFAKDDPANTVLIDASGTVDQVHSHLKNILNERFLS